MTNPDPDPVSGWDGELREHGHPARCCMAGGEHLRPLHGVLSTKSIARKRNLRWYERGLNILKISIWGDVFSWPRITSYCGSTKARVWCMWGQHPVTTTQGLVKQYHSMRFTLVREQNLRGMTGWICLFVSMTLIRASSPREGTNIHCPGACSAGTENHQM